MPSIGPRLTPDRDLLGPWTISDAPLWHESYARLHRTGWSIGDAAFAGPTGRDWLVSGHNGENLIRAEGPTQGAAWWGACRQAEAVGMLEMGSTWRGEAGEGSTS